MSLTLALLRTDLRDHLGKPKLSDVGADRLLNRSWWALASQLRFSERDAVGTFTTVAGTEEYAVPIDSDAVQRVRIQDPDTEEWFPLIHNDDGTLFAQKDSSTDARAFPERYSRRNDNFVLAPIPDDAYKIEVKYLRTLDDIQASGPEAPQEWHEVILWGAVARGFFADGDWDRGTKAQAQQALYIQSLDTTEIKETEDRIMSGVRVLKRRYP